MNLKTLFAALLIGLLAACGGNTSEDVQPPAAQLGEAETSAAMSDLQGELFRTALSLNGDASTLALRNFPADAAGFPMTDQEGGATLPRGQYTYDQASDAWQREGESDDLSLTWRYEGRSAQEVEATLELDWDAGAQTVTLEGPDGETLEAPTAFNLTMSAGGQEVADVDLALSYYNTQACGTSDGIAEPTSLIVDGAGSLLDLEDVGYSVQEGDEDKVTTRGKVSLIEEVTLEWTVDLLGEREREDCFTSDYVPTSGNVNIGLATEAGRFALGLGVDSIDLKSGSATLSNGALQINDQVAVTFEGTLDDANGNGVPGENVTLSFANGKTVTLEQVLQSSKLGMMMRGLKH